MAPPPDATDAGQTRERDTFVLQLPKRIAAVEEIWSRLERGDWNAAQLEALYERIQEISDSSKTFSLFQLNESALSLEVYLSSFIGADIKPGDSQVEAITGLVQSLKTAANVTASAEHDRPAGSENTQVFLLGDAPGALAGLDEALRKHQCDVEQFTDTQALVDVLSDNPPSVIVADTAKLAEIAPLSAELVRLRTHLSLDIPLVFVSDSSALQLRVDAIRSGGVGYFVTPIDLAGVAAQISALSNPDAETPHKVLVVEDDPTQADFAASILRKNGIQALQVTEPIKVLDQLRDFKPDLILMDIYMPEVNGIELTTVIRDHREFVTIPIVFLSGEQNADKQLDALSVGGDDFITKPIRPKHLLGVVQTRIRRARQMLSATGQPPKHDRVTGLFSRQHFLDMVGRAIESQHAATAAAVMFVRPDERERLRSKLGVGGVDHLLAEFGSIITDISEDADIAARIDDDSFGILLRRSSRDAIAGFGDALLERIAANAFAEQIRTTASIGLCFITDRHDDANGILSRAKAACSNAELQGGNCVSVHGVDEDSQQVATTKAENVLGQRVTEALRDDRFVTRYQPMLDLRTRGSETYELLMYMESAHGDLITGTRLLEAAESAGACEDLDHWILNRAVDILKERRDTGRRTTIFVHQSMHSALNASMPAWLTGRLRAKQTVGTGLVIDFHLPDLSQDLKTAQRNIQGLRDMDIEVSLSRFPEKEAAFKVLRFLQADYIKVLPRLLKADRHVISSVIEHAHGADAKVIVSNIDDPRSIDLHWSSGADFLQGNFIQRPLENMDYDFSQVVI